MLNLFKIMSALLLAVVVMLSFALAKLSSQECVTTEQPHLSKLKTTLEEERDKDAGVLQKLRNWTRKQF